MILKQSLFIIRTTAIGILFVILSCSEPKKTGKELKIPEIVKSQKDGIHAEGNTLWPVNKATQIGVNKMNDIINSFSICSNPKDFDVLSKTLEDEMITLFSKCDMKGKAHDELHNFLLPIHADIEKLKIGDVTERTEILKSIKYRLHLFPLYFKS